MQNDVDDTSMVSGGGPGRPPRSRTRTAAIGCGSLLGIFMLFGIVGSLTDDSSSTQPDGPTPNVVASGASAVPSAATVQESSVPTPTPTPVPPTPTPTPEPTPTAVPTPTMNIEQDKASYRADVDVRELYKNIHKYTNWKLYYEGEVLSIHESADGTIIQLTVQWGPGILDSEVIDLAYTTGVDTTGIYQGSRIAVWGRPITTFTITNAFGGNVEQPLLAGDYLEPLE